MKIFAFAIRVGLCCLACLFSLPARGQALADFLQSGLNMQHVVIPVYAGPEKNLALLVHVDNAHTEYEKRGFFHIGTLPVAVLEGVTFEAREAAPGAPYLNRLRAWLGVDAGNHVELRQVKFLVSPTLTLEAGRVVMAGHDQWELLGGVRLLSGTNEVRAEKATLLVGGPQAGQVILPTTPPSTNFFLMQNSTATLAQSSK